MYHTKDIKGQAPQASDNTTRSVHKACELSEEKLQKSWKTLQEKSSDLQENIVTYVQENPFKSLGFAALTGLIFAQLLRKRDE